MSEPEVNSAGECSWARWLGEMAESLFLPIVVAVVVDVGSTTEKRKRSFRADLIS